jgi:pimeloyl-ACP methyl ester carboxylesterase
MTLLMDTFLGEGAFMRFPEPLRRRVMRGAADWSAQTTSTAAFPTLTHEMAASIRVPVLMLGGERTLDVHRLTDRALRRAIPHAERIVIPGATHDLWADEPVRSREAAMAFLERVGRDGEAVGDGR